MCDCGECERTVMSEEQRRWARWFISRGDSVLESLQGTAQKAGEKAAKEIEDRALRLLAKINP